MQSRSRWFIDAILPAPARARATTAARITRLAAGLLVLATAAASMAAAALEAEHGTLVDRASGLAWKRCSEGQRWIDGACNGLALPHRYDEAQAMAELARFGGHADWRLPDRVELAAVVAHPAWFGDPTLRYWSATRIAHGTDGAFVVGAGGEEVASLHEGHAVRLVRRVQPAP
jgi:hypothetical protein